jgi:hypothetical protein
MKKFIEGSTAGMTEEFDHEEMHMDEPDFE